MLTCESSCCTCYLMASKSTSLARIKSNCVWIRFIGNKNKLLLEAELDGVGKLEDVRSIWDGGKKDKSFEEVKLYKKFVYGNYTFCIRFVYIFENSVIRFRTFYKDCFLRWFFKETIYTEFLRNCYGISNNVIITRKIINIIIISK